MHNITMSKGDFPRKAYWAGTISMVLSTDWASVGRLIRNTYEKRRERGAMRAVAPIAGKLRVGQSTGNRFCASSYIEPALNLHHDLKGV